MQSERIKICSHNMLAKGCKWHKIVPLQTDATVDDILVLFAKYLMDGQAIENQDLQVCFQTLFESTEDIMFVFMRRGTSDAAGILRSKKPLFNERERALMKRLGEKSWNLPLWTWKESDYHLTQAMERQCREYNGPCMGIWCYR